MALSALALGDGIPFVSMTATRLPGGIKLIDGVTALIVACLFVGNARALVQLPQTSRTGRFLIVWSAALATWWFVTVLRSAIFANVPVHLAALYGRDIMYFAILVPLLYSALSRPGVLWDTAVLLGPAVAVISLLELIAVSFGVNVTNILNVASTYQENGISRLYVPVNGLVTLALPCALGVGLFAHSSRTRISGAAVALLCLGSVAFQLTRAVYLGILIGCVLALMAWLSGRSRGPARRRFGLALILIASLGVVVALYLPPATVSNTPISGVTSRIVSIKSAVSDPTDTLAFRSNLRLTMYQVIGDRWLVGLGFVHPSAHYFEDLPLGDLRNKDIGVLNAVATMGVVGALLMLLPVVYLLGRTLLLARGQVQPDETWIHFGFCAWAVYALVTIPNLVVLFSPTDVAAFAVAAGAASTAVRSTGGQTAN